MCCLLNVTAGAADTCTSDGFCIPWDNNGIWRALCTDQSWKDPACINLCTTGIGMYISVGSGTYFLFLVSMKLTYVNRRR